MSVVASHVVTRHAIHVYPEILRPKAQSPKPKAQRPRAQSPEPKPKPKAQDHKP